MYGQMRLPFCPLTVGMATQPELKYWLAIWYGKVPESCQPFRFTDVGTIEREHVVIVLDRKGINDCALTIGIIGLAIAEAWDPGQEGGTAVARALGM
jgi:hypothetical protein